MLQPNSRTIYRILCCSFFLLLACQKQPDTKPENVLTEEVMVKILSEIHLTEASITKMGVNNPDSSRVMYDYLEARIYKKFQTDSTQYKRSYRYYVSQPETFKHIYEQVVADLEKKSNLKK